VRGRGAKRVVRWRVRLGSPDLLRSRRELDGNATGTRREYDGNSTGIRREYHGNPPMAADQRGFLPARVLMSARLPSSVIYCHHRGIFFPANTAQGGVLVDWRPPVAPAAGSSQIRRGALMKGRFPYKMDLPVPISGWYSR